MKKIALSTALAFSGFILAAGPAAAQENSGDKVTQKIVYGDDPCEPSVDPSEIVVCMRMDEDERYRIPESLRSDPNSVKNEAWTERVRAIERVGASGIDSCSPSGAGGFTGCTQEMIRSAYAEKATGPAAQAGKLIQEAREERLANIDADAEAVEAREREIEAELEASRAKREAEEEAGQQRQPGTDLAVPPSG
ncbi:MAG: hypothetical protein R3E02_00910 [Blastomonas sp.]